MSDRQDSRVEQATDRAVQGAIPKIVAALEHAGVTGVHSFLAFSGEPVIWLVTATDAEKQRVEGAGFFIDRVRAELREAGVVDELAARASVTAESQETVDRDFEGKWFYAMR